jgi:N-methylhydantoinase A/oxoprolinase/acetone carboxylase beta subunit
VLSAFGMLVAPIRRAASRTVFRSGQVEADFDLAGIFDELEEEAAGGLARELGTAGREAIGVQRTIDARYRGQSYELAVAADGWLDAFHAAHRARYGYASPNAEVEAVTLRVEAVAPGVTVGATSLATAPAPAAESVGDVFAESRWLPAPRYGRDALPAGHVIAGPAIITEYSATTWLPPGWTAEVLAGGSILLRTEGGT